MRADSNALRMIDCIYRAASEPSHWQEFASQLSNAYDGAAVVIGMALAGPASSHYYFTAGLPTNVGPSLLSNFLTGLPFEPTLVSENSNRFGTIDEMFPDLTLEDTDFFRDWMKPHWLAPVWPISHAMTLHGDLAPALLNVFRKQGGGEFTPDELAMGDKLVPHLKRAFEIYEDLSNLHRSRKELDEVIDRLRIGVILTDVAGRPVLMNRSARMMIEIGEDIRMEQGRICATVKTDDDLLQSALDDATTGQASRAVRIGEDTPSKHGLHILVNPLTAALPGSQVREAAAALFLSGPETFSGLSLRYLRGLYGLTAAEAELVALLVGGDSLEEAARNRGVALNTARSQLKQAFAKTETHSQSDLVQLVLGSLSSVSEA
jgi:DNA-binding CsgD family transcriptional regulator